MTREHHRPFTPGAAFFEARDGGVGAEQLREAADRTATLLVRGARDTDDPALAQRVLHLADNEGLETLAELWRGAPPESLAGVLWRLYVLRTWVHAAPVQAAREFEAGRGRHDVAEVLAGVADPPGPDEVRAMIDDALRGICEGEFADVLLRAGAFARVVAAGRAAGADQPADQVVRMLALAEHLERAGHEELAGRLA
ncbi:MAG: hypothetical protein V9G04_02555 [Nocardioides sp.]|jgi:hypothetical protein